MFRLEEFQTIVSIEEIRKVSETTVPIAELKKPGYWAACQRGKRDWQCAEKNGIEVTYEVEEDGSVHSVTFHLDESRKGTLQRFIERRQSVDTPQS